MIKNVTPSKQDPQGASHFLISLNFNSQKFINKNHCLKKFQELKKSTKISKNQQLKLQPKKTQIIFRTRDSEPCK